jgi:hypothetical protein
MSLTLHATLKGLSGAGGQPISFQGSGPFATSPAGKAALDLNSTLTVAGQTIPIGLIVLGGKGEYLEFAGTYYSLPLSSSTSAAATGASGDAGLMNSLGIHPLDWLTNPQLVGTPAVDGVKTDHLSAGIAVSTLLADVVKLARSEKGFSKTAGSALNSANLSEISSAITASHVDIYSGVSDHVLRRMSLSIAFSVPSVAQSSAGGLKGGSVSFQFDITNLNAPESIKAPAHAQPFSSLLGGSGGLLSGLGA